MRYQDSIKRKFLLPSIFDYARGRRGLIGKLPSALPLDFRSTRENEPSSLKNWQVAQQSTAQISPEMVQRLIEHITGHYSKRIGAEFGIKAHKQTVQKAVAAYKCRACQKVYNTEPTRQKRFEFARKYSIHQYKMYGGSQGSSSATATLSQVQRSWTSRTLLVR